MGENESASRATPIREHKYRLPTVSASQALRDSESSTSQKVAFHVEGLDSLLEGGLERGRITGVFGPPGAGKTTLCLQVAANALNEGHGVIWVDTSSRLPSPRLKNAIAAKEDSYEDALFRFHHYTTPTLAHLIALLSATAPSFPPEKTAILVIDSFSVLLDIAYGRNSNHRGGFNKKTDQQRWLEGRRQAMLSDLTSKLSKFAILHRVAVVVVNNVVTKIQKDTQALLRTGITGPGWENAVAINLCLFRGSYSGSEESDGGRRRHARFVSVLKGTDAESIGHINGANVVSFKINDDGIQELPGVQSIEADHDFHTTAETRGRKRTHAVASESDDERSDSDYGWGEEEVQLAAEGLVDDSYLQRDTDVAN